jgi:microcystin degradation protein MlrC
MTSGRELRIAYGRIFHEANAHSPLLTEREDFERMHHVADEELARASTLRGVELKSFMPHAELTGFRQAARLAGAVETVPLASSLAVPNGPVSKACFEWLVEGLERRLRGAGRLDGVYLALHGSMQVDGLGEVPEAAILRRVRAAAPGAKIAVSFDLHANLTAAVLDQIDVLVAYRTNPHWDLAPTGFRAGKRLIAALRGKQTPVHAWRKLPMVLGGGTTIDFVAPMRGVFGWGKRQERAKRLLTANLFMVHPYTTAADLGWAVHVTTDGDARLAEELADAYADQAWSVRNVQMPRSYGADEALEEVARSPWRKLGPVTLVDGDDIVGAGAPGGNTRIVQALARDDRGLRVYVPVHDPALVEELWQAPPGVRRPVTLRGTPGYHAPAVELDAKVAARETTDFGRTVRLDVGSFHVVVTDRSPLPIHPSFWSTLGLNARDADAIVQKNFFHYRLFYATTSFRHLLVQTDGATSLERVRTQPYRVPTHPRDHVRDWRDHAEALRG